MRLSWAAVAGWASSVDTSISESVATLWTGFLFISREFRPVSRPQTGCSEPDAGWTKAGIELIHISILILESVLAVEF